LSGAALLASVTEALAGQKGFFPGEVADVEPGRERDVSG
jgi:hypothetical protein